MKDDRTLQQNNSSPNMYRDGSYIAQNPSLHMEDVSYKLTYLLELLKDEKFSERGIRILDIGGGAGLIAVELCKKLSSRGIKVECVGLDLSLEMLAVQQANNSYMVATTDELATAVAMGPYDLTLLIDVIEHVPEPFILAEEIDRISDRILYNIPTEINLFDFLKNIYMRGQYYPMQKKSLGHLHFFSWNSAKRFIRKNHRAIRWQFPAYAAHVLSSNHPGYRRQLNSRLRKAELTLSRLIQKTLPIIAPYIVQGSMFVLSHSRTRFV
jgi:hypothetical protein